MSVCFLISFLGVQVLKLEPSNSSQILQPCHALVLISFRVLHTFPISASIVSVLRMTWRNSWASLRGIYPLSHHLPL